MTQSLRERLLLAVMGALLPVAISQGAKLLRSPAIAVSRESSPVLLVFPESDTIIERPNNRVERHLALRIVALTRGDAAVTEADSLLVAAHAALMQDPSLGGLSLGLQEIDCEWDQDDADAGAVALPARYQIRYRTFANDLTQQG